MSKSCFTVKLLRCRCKHNESEAFSVATASQILDKKSVQMNKFITQFLCQVHLLSNTKNLWWRCAQGKHPFPSRTRWLRPKRPMVLCWRRHGRVGGRQLKKKITLNSDLWQETKVSDKSFLLQMTVQQSKTSGMAGKFVP